MIRAPLHLLTARGWTAVHFREGDLKHCRKAHVVDNEIVSNQVSLVKSISSHPGPVRRRMGR